MLPSMSCAMTSSRMLPPVWLNSHVYQNVTAIVTTKPLTRTEACKPPGSQKKRGKCQPATSGARIEVATSGEYPNPCSPGRATPLLAQRPVRGVDQAHGEHHEEGAQGGEGQRRDARPGRDVEPYDGQVD
jgi:hypothetical protein